APDACTAAYRDGCAKRYASGLREGHYVVAVTRGLIDTLADDELEAVLAHELTHIRDRDTQLMVIAIIFAGVSPSLAASSSAAGTFPMAGRPGPGGSGRWVPQRVRKAAGTARQAQPGRWRRGHPGDCRRHCHYSD